MANIALTTPDLANRRNSRFRDLVNGVVIGKLSGQAQFPLFPIRLGGIGRQA